MAGVQENRVRTGLSGAKAEQISSGALEWRRCAELLENVRYALTEAGKASEALGGHTGPALGKKFHHTAERVREKAKDLNKGSIALTNASNVIVEADEAVTAMEEKYNASEPSGFTPKPAWQLKTKEDVEDERDRASAHQADVRAYQADVEARERISRHWADRMDAVFEESTITMKEIHGIPDPEPGDPGDGGDDRTGSINPRPGTPQGPDRKSVV